MSGYSGTPLAQKLGLRAGARLFVHEPPAHYRRLLAPLPPGVATMKRIDQRADVIHVFAMRRAALARLLPRARRGMRADAALWVSWPKRAAKVSTDLTEDVVRELALPLGLVDVKVCAVDEVWSGLKLMVRRSERAAPSAAPRPR
jgi:hypothetical protein